MLRMSLVGGKPPRPAAYPHVDPALDSAGVKRGVWGEAPKGRLPPGLHSKMTFMAEGPLEGPGGP